MLWCGEGCRLDLFFVRCDLSTPSQRAVIPLQAFCTRYAVMSRVLTVRSEFLCTIGTAFSPLSLNPSRFKKNDAWTGRACRSPCIIRNTLACLVDDLPIRPHTETLNILLCSVGFPCVFRSVKLCWPLGTRAGWGTEPTLQHGRCVVPRRHR